MLVFFKEFENNSSSFFCPLVFLPVFVVWRLTLRNRSKCLQNGLEMHAKKKCRACGKSFVADPRNHQRQAFCKRPKCQRTRRSETQRKRRKQVSIKGRLKPTDAAWLQQHPLIIGLVALLIGSSDKQDIQNFCAAATQRGVNILNIPIVDEHHKEFNSNELGRNKSS